MCNDTLRKYQTQGFTTPPPRPPSFPDINATNIFVKWIMDAARACLLVSIALKSQCWKLNGLNHNFGICVIKRNVF